MFAARTLIISAALQPSHTAALLLSLSTDTKGHEQSKGKPTQNHRMTWVAKDHNAHPVPTPCCVQGRQPADQAAQSHIQPGLECLQGWGIHNFFFKDGGCYLTSVTLHCWEQ